MSLELTELLLHNNKYNYYAAVLFKIQANPHAVNNGLSLKKQPSKKDYGIQPF